MVRDSGRMFPKWYFRAVLAVLIIVVVVVSVTGCRWGGGTAGPSWCQTNSIGSAPHRCGP